MKGKPLFTKNNIPNVGDRFWLIAPSLESYGYGDYTAQEPWLGEVVSNDREVCHIARVGYDDSLDLDSNASTYVDEYKVLFKTEAEARTDYLAELRNQIAEAKESLELLHEKLAQFEKEWT